MIGQYETNLRNPKHETLFKIATALKIQPHELYSEMQWLSCNVEFLDSAANAFTLLSGFLEGETAPRYIQKTIRESIPNLDEIYAELPDLLAAIATASVYKVLDTPTQAQSKLLSLFESLNDAGKAIAIERLLELSEIPRYQQENKEAPK